MSAVVCSAGSQQLGQWRTAIKPIAGLHGRGIGWIDGDLLASALAARLELWTTDPALATVAKELGISYE